MIRRLLTAPETRVAAYLALGAALFLLIGA